MNLGDAKKLLEELAYMSSFEHLTLTGGDPQAYPGIDSLLEHYIKLRERIGKKMFVMQITTALARDLSPEQAELWRRSLIGVRVSLDALDNDLYQYVRNDKETTPELVLNRIRSLAGGTNLVSTFTTVFPRTLDHLPEMLKGLQEFYDSGVSLRKAIFFPALGRVKNSRTEEYWEKWKEVADHLGELCPTLPTSFAEVTPEVMEVLDSDRVENVRCYEGNIAFHIKPNGDYYPCCLVGGEALDTNIQFHLGNVFEPWESIETIWYKYVPKKHYCGQDSVCRSLCQYKQLALNLVADEVKDHRLSMP